MVPPLGAMRLSALVAGVIGLVGALLLGAASPAAAEDIAPIRTIVGPNTGTPAPQGIGSFPDGTLVVSDTSNETVSFLPLVLMAMWPR